MARNDAESVAATLGRAKEIPDDTGLGANPTLPSLFGTFPIPDGEEIVDRLQHPKDPKKLKNVPAYNLQAHLKRFIVGSIYIEAQGGGKGTTGEVVEHDDSAEYEMLLNDMLLGKSILRWEEKSTLKDGTFVITVCYFTVKDPPPKRSTDPFADTKS
jgi:hypothetical protein